jgi:hypothetical protein
MKKLTLEDMHKLDELLSEAEYILGNTILDNESYLINYIRSYIRIKRRMLKEAGK